MNCINSQLIVAFSFIRESYGASLMRRSGSLGTKPHNGFSLFLQNYWSHALAIAGSTLLAVVGVIQAIEDKTWEWKSAVAISFCVGLLGSVVGQISQLVTAPGVASLQIELNKTLGTLNQRRESDLKVIKNELLVLSKVLEFSPSERVSLYMHIDSTLIMIGRYSSNPVFDAKGRGFHSQDEGIVGIAWRNGQAFVDNLPESVGDDDFEYCRECELKYGFRRDTAHKLRMKSRTLGAYSIENSDGINTAIIVFESANAKAFTDATIRNVLYNGGEIKRISFLLEQAENIIPNPELASRAGF